MSRLRVCLFGKFSIHSDDRAIQGIDGSKAQELFGYLLCHRDRPHTREALADLLWSDSAAAQSKKYLRQALWLLQSALNEFFLPVKNPLLQIDSEWVRLNSHERLWLDVAFFERCFEHCSNEAGARLKE